MLNVPFQVAGAAYKLGNLHAMEALETAVRHAIQRPVSYMPFCVEDDGQSDNLYYNI